MIVFDMDGTLFDTPLDVAWDDPAALEASSTPRQGMCLAVKTLVKDLVVVTGRKHMTAAATLRQLNAEFGDVSLWTCPRNVPFEQLAAWKATILRSLGCTLYVGDSAADREAAELAGALHCSPETFQAWAEDHIEHKGLVA